VTGVLVYFGYPRAHEDDAERAVRAGLELIAAVGALRASSPLQTRVGIATGLVVVGDLIGSGEAQERGIVGETPNLAARLQGIAEPNTVVIAESTRKLLGNLFDLQDLGTRDLKGIAGSVRAWAALRPASVESRFEALHASGLTELVGREEELELLLRRWSRAKSGEGQVVLLSGEAGIGKSRLTAALLEAIASEPHIRLRYFCSPQHTDSALHPIIGQMERAARFAHEDALEAKLNKLDRLLAQTSTSIEDTGLFADMLSLPGDARYPLLQLEPQQRRQRTLQALVLQLEALTRQNPVLMIFEDAHWSDPTSLEVLGRIVDRIALMATHGMAAPVVREAYARARVLAEKLGRSDYLIPVAYGQWLIHLARSEGAQALSNAERMEEIGHAHDDCAITLLGYYMHGQTCLYRGDLVEARTLFERGRLLGDPAHRAVHAKLVTADPQILTVALLGVTLTLLGYFDQGRSLAKDALHMARQLKHAHTLTYRVGGCHHYHRRRNRLIPRCAHTRRRGNNTVNRARLSNVVGFWKCFTRVLVSHARANTRGTCCSYTSRVRCARGRERLR
jgi:hypothetical protein